MLEDRSVVAVVRQRPVVVVVVLFMHEVIFPHRPIVLIILNLVLHAHVWVGINGVSGGAAACARGASRVWLGGWFSVVGIRIARSLLLLLKRVEACQASIPRSCHLGRFPHYNRGRRAPLAIGAFVP